MKKIFSLAILSLGFMGQMNAQEKDKAKRPSPPASVSQTIASGATIKIDYSQPSVKGRTIGKDLEPMDGAVWRTGANEATVFETSKDIKVNGQKLAAGKYGLFTIAGKNEWTIIFNKTWDQWGAFDYKPAADALRIKVEPGTAKDFSEKMTFTIGNNGRVDLLWGKLDVGFEVQ